MPRRVCIKEVVAEAYKNVTGGNQIPDLVKQLMGFFTSDLQKPNYVMVYRGSFNPPHRGHLLTLKAGLAVGKYIGSEIKAALIIPNSSEQVMRKYLHREAKSRVFSVLQRCKLWTSEHEFPLDRAWVWGEELESNCDFEELFLDELVEIVGPKFGVKIELVYLSGEDLAVRKPPEISFIQDIGYSKIVVQRGESNNLLRDSDGEAAIWKHARNQIPMDQIGYRDGYGAVWKSQPGFFTNGHFFCYAENSQRSRDYSSSELNGLLEAVKQEKEVTDRKEVIGYALSGKILLSHI